MKRTIAVVWTLVPTRPVIVHDILTIHHNMLCTFWPHVLIVTSTIHPLITFHPPLLESTHCYILAQQHIKRCVDLSEHPITDENDVIETFKDHADFCSGVPSIVTTCWMERSIEAVATSSTHGFKERGTIFAIREQLVTIFVTKRRRYVEVC